MKTFVITDPTGIATQTKIRKVQKHFPFADPPKALATKKAEEEKLIPYSTWLIKPVSMVKFLRDYASAETLSKAQMETMKLTFGDNPTEKFFNVEQVILKIGQGGGKNFEITYAIVYAIYLWCCLSDPHKHFNMKYHEPFDILNYSQVNETQARKVFFSTLAAIMKTIIDPTTGKNWFVQHMGMKIAEYGAKDIKDREMTIPNRDRNRGDIRVFCLDTEAKSVEGYTIWITIMDEPSRANTPVKYAKALHQYNTACTNHETRHPPNNRLTVVFAYPEQEINDLLVELFNRYSVNPAENTQEIQEGVLTAWYWTWIYNAKDRKAKKESYRKKYNLDPMDADRRFKAKEPPNEYGFFMPHIFKIDECANPLLPKLVEYKPTITRRTEKINGILQEVEFTALELISVKGDNKTRWWGGDFSKNKDRLTLVSGYAEVKDRDVEEYVYKEWERKEGVQVEKKITVDCRPIIDIILVWEPKLNKPIDYVNVEDIIMDLFETHFPNSKSLHFDQFQTESIRQKLLDVGVNDCKTLSASNPQQVKYGRLLRYMVWNNAIEYPDDGLLKKEMRQLLLINNSKLQHPSTGSKDVYDSLSICAYNIVTNAHLGSALDIGEGTKSDELEDQKMANMYLKAYKLFLKRNNHPPGDTAVLRKFMILEGIGRWSLEQIEYARQLWVEHASDLSKRILGMGKVDTGIISTSDVDLMKEIDQLDLAEDTLDRDNF